MSRQIKPDVDEISLAFDPANRKKFFMQKEGGQEGMDKLIEILMSKDKMFKEAKIEKFLKDLDASDEVKDAIRGSLKILTSYKDQLPATLNEQLIKAVPELKNLLSVSAPISDEDRKKIEKETEKKLTKEIEKRLTKEIETKLEKAQGDDDKQIKLLKDEIETLRKEIKVEKETAEKERDIRRINEIKTLIKDNGIPGDLEKVSKVMLTLEKMSPEVSKDVQEMLNQAGVMIKASAAFGEFGGTGGGTDKSDKAYEKLNDMVTEAMTKDKTLSVGKAWENVVRANPDLYQEHVQAQGATAQ